MVLMPEFALRFSSPPLVVFSGGRSEHRQGFVTGDKGIVQALFEAGELRRRFFRFPPQLLLFVLAQAQLEVVDLVDGFDALRKGDAVAGSFPAPVPGLFHAAGEVSRSRAAGCDLSERVAEEGLPLTVAVAAKVERAEGGTELSGFGHRVGIDCEQVSLFARVGARDDVVSL